MMLNFRLRNSTSLLFYNSESCVTFIIHRPKIMPFDRRYVSLIMNGINYTDDKLLAPISVGIKPNEIGANWQESLHQFILDWVNEKDRVTVHTSGSTGTPKQIQLIKECMMNSAFMTGKYFDFKSGQKALLCLPCDYIAGKMMVVRAIMWVPMAA